MLGNTIYKNGKVYKRRFLETEDSIIIKTTNADNDIINETNLTEIVTYYRNYFSN